MDPPTALCNGEGDEAGVEQRRQPVHASLPHRSDPDDYQSDFAFRYCCLLVYAAPIKEWNSAV